VTVNKAAFVAVEGSSYSFDKPFSYLTGDDLEEKAQAGKRVLVPFGNGNKGRQGIIVGFGCYEGTRKLKQIVSIIDEVPLISAEHIELAEWIKEQYFCTLYEALKLMLPAGLNLFITIEYSLARELQEQEYAALTDSEKKVVERIRENLKPVEKNKLLEKLGSDANLKTISSLKEKNIVIERSSIDDKKSESSITMIRLCASAEQTEELLAEAHGITAKQKKVLKMLLELGAATVKEICYFTGVTSAVINGLIKKEILEQYEKRIFRNPYKDSGSTIVGELVLSQTQQAAYDNLLKRYQSGKASASLLFGITGSGKTSVFMKLIENVLSDHKSVIVLVPEISLTPQAVQRFYSRFGDKVAVLHSGLSVGERLDEWERINGGNARIVVGTRSAVFAPCKNLGMIIIDEEQEYTYKSESSPRYHARDIARFRCAKNNALLLLASATPSVETFYAAQTGRYGLERLDERYGTAILPHVVMADMKEEIQNGNTSVLSDHLLNELRNNIVEKRQSILLMNRRGFNTFISCGECGTVINCPNCSIPMTYHSANERLMCHYCGYSIEVPAKCPNCESRHIKYSGAGTQKIEQTITELLPDAKVLRMDMDTTINKFSHEKILTKFECEHYDILIGTQMVAKGLDFPSVTLVGVISADQMLFMNDFRASERTFSLLTQVIGRSGRGTHEGRAIIQTACPENLVLNLAAKQDYDAFYKNEITMRKILLYPPFCDICEIYFSGILESDVFNAAQGFLAALMEEKNNHEKMPLRILGPAPAAILKINNRYRYKIIIKCRNNKAFRGIISKLLISYYEEKISKKVFASVDINPLSSI
jgi:primosomal protein N' (replication factor Y)